MVSRPPGMKPPGWKPPPERIKEYERNRSIGLFIKGLHDAEQARKKKRKPTVDHITDFRSADGRLRAKDSGRFVTDPVPNHKRTKPIIPWNKGMKKVQG